MALFITKENQELLYEMINKTPNINTIFPTPNEKNAWFRAVIESYYIKLPNIISRDQLKSTNREVLGYMIKMLQPQKEEIPKITKIKREHAPDYESKEAQYKSLFETPKPQVIDFSEKIEDGVITNMDELIENHKKMREYELQEYAPPPIEGSIEKNSINIMQDVSTDVLQITSLMPDEKRVKFGVSQETIYEEFEKMNKKIDLISEKMDLFLSQMKDANTPIKPI